MLPREGERFQGRHYLEEDRYDDAALFALNEDKDEKQIMYVVHVAVGLLYVLMNVFINIMNVLITKYFVLCYCIIFFM